MRIGILGGSFDPVHLGHLWIGEEATESLSLDRLLWIPSATQPLKPAGANASDEQRLMLLKLAVAGREGHEVDDRELRREGVSYTVDTIEEIRREQPDDELFLIIGSDSLASMPQWHRPERLLEQVTLAVVQRGGDPDLDFGVLEGMVESERIERFERAVIQMPQIEISSSELRDRVAGGRSIRHRVPRSVEASIDALGIYRDGPGAE